MSTASGSGGFTPWTSWWNTTKRHLSSPVSTGRSSTSSERCSDARPQPCHVQAVGAALTSPEPGGSAPGRSRAHGPSGGGLRPVRWFIGSWLPLPRLPLRAGRFVFPLASPSPGRALTPTFQPAVLPARCPEREVEEGGVRSLYSCSTENSLSLFRLFVLTEALIKQTSGTVGTHRSCR